MRDGTNEYNKILLLTDLTDKSLSALSYARAFADFYNAYLGVLHVLPPPKARAEADGAVPQRQSKAAADIRKRMESLAQALRADGITAQIRLCRGAVTTRTILRNIRAVRPDLIIQGCGAIDDFRRPFLGSVAEVILRSTDRPVLTVPAGLKATTKSLRFNRILLATDFGSALRTVSYHVLSLVQEFGSQLYLCHVCDSKSQQQWDADEIQTIFCNELDRLVVRSAHNVCTPKCVVRFGQPSEVIVRLADQENCDLIVLGAHALGPVGTRGRPGTVFRVISGARCPVLTISSTKREDADIKAEQVEVITA